jgi:hypothetical protein
MPQYRRCGGILATAYAIGDVFSLRQSLHRKPHDAKGFYAIYFGLIIIAAVVVVTRRDAGYAARFGRLPGCCC